MNKTWRHGDVQLIKVSKLPADAELISGRKELAFGETTGHAHRIDSGDLFFTKDGSLYLQVDKLSEISHEEHKAKPVEPGCYLVGIKRQYDAKNGWQQVRD
jgi:hypothetical protein